MRWFFMRLFLIPIYTSPEWFIDKCRISQKALCYLFVSYNRFYYLRQYVHVGKTQIVVSSVSKWAILQMILHMPVQNSAQKQRLKQLHPACDIM